MNGHERKRPWKKFGKQLADARNKKGLQAKEVAVALKCSDASISNWETGVNPPSRESLMALATLYGADWIEWLHTLFLAEYFDEELTHKYLSQDARKKSELLWEYICAGQKRLRGISDLTGIAMAEFRSLISFAGAHQVLDRAGQVAWEGSLRFATPRLECFWVATLCPVDDEKDYYDVAIANIRAGAMYVYFILAELAPEFRAVLDRFDKDLGQEVRQRLVRVHPIQRADESIVGLDFVAANPHLAAEELATGFLTIWPGRQIRQIPYGKDLYNLRLPPRMLRDRITTVKEALFYLAKNDPEHYGPITDNDLFPGSLTKRSVIRQS